VHRAKVSGVTTQEERLEQWWQSLTDDLRTGLLEADLRRSLDSGLVDVVSKSRVVGVIGTWWEGDIAGATWYATERMREYVASKGD